MVFRARVEVLWRRDGAARADDHVRSRRLRPDPPVRLHARRQEAPHHRSHQPRVDRVRGRAPGPAGRRGGRPHRLRPRKAHDRARAARLPEPARRARARRQRARASSRRSPTSCASAGAASTASCTRSPSRPRTRSAGGSSTRRPRARATAFQTSAYSYKALAAALEDLYPEEGAAIVGMDFDAQVAWPVYDWMGVAKAALEARQPLPGARPRPARRAREPRVRGPAGHARRARHPRLQRPRRRHGSARRRWAGTPRTRARGRRGSVPAQRPRARDHRRGPARRRRLPRDGHGAGGGAGRRGRAEAAGMSRPCS